MIIHTVQPGDTIFKIARQYSTSPMKIIENNELLNPDKLAVGQKLLILMPTRTYTVRGSDTLYRIAERFGVKYTSLLSANPYLSGTDRIYPGQILTIKHDTPCYGMACANGYYYNNTSKERLMLAMPYLTHLTVTVGKRIGNAIQIFTDSDDVVSEAKKMGKIALMRVYDNSGDTEINGEYASFLIKLAKEKNFDGITLASYKAIEENPNEYAKSLVEFKKLLLDSELMLYLEIDANKQIKIPDIADGYVIMYEKCSLEKIPTFDDGERKVFLDFAEEREPNKAYIDLTPFAYIGGEEASIKEAVAQAYSCGLEILEDSEKGICHFSYNRYKAGKKEIMQVVFESLENVKSKLEAVGEYGFMGISFDIMNVPIEYLMMFETMFSRPTAYMQKNF